MTNLNAPRARVTLLSVAVVAMTFLAAAHGLTPVVNDQFSVDVLVEMKSKAQGHPTPPTTSMRGYFDFPNQRIRYDTNSGEFINIMLKDRQYMKGHQAGAPAGSEKPEQEKTGVCYLYAFKDSDFDHVKELWGRHESLYAGKETVDGVECHKWDSTKNPKKAPVNTPEGTTDIFYVNVKTGLPYKKVVKNEHMESVSTFGNYTLGPGHDGLYAIPESVKCTNPPSKEEQQAAYAKAQAEYHRKQQAQQAQNGYGQNPYGQHPYGQAGSGKGSAHQNPYAQHYQQQQYQHQQNQHNPYAAQHHSQNPYAAGGQSAHGQNSHAQNPYGQHAQNPYGQHGQNPYAQHHQQQQQQQHHQNPYANAYGHGSGGHQANPYGAQHPYGQAGEAHDRDEYEDEEYGREHMDDHHDDDFDDSGSHDGTHDRRPVRRDRRGSRDRYDDRRERRRESRRVVYRDDNDDDDDDDDYAVAAAALREAERQYRREARTGGGRDTGRKAKKAKGGKKKKGKKKAGKKAKKGKAAKKNKGKKKGKKAAGYDDELYARDPKASNYYGQEDDPYGYDNLGMHGEL